MCALGLWCMSATPALAQVVAPPAATPSNAAPPVAMPSSTASPANTRSSSALDVVRLTDGGLLRGTISELRVGDSVTLLTVLGEVRKIPWQSVAYAGPANGLPPVSAPAAAAPSGPQVVGAPAELASVTLRSEPEGLVFHRQSDLVVQGSRGPLHIYEPLCTAPCTMGLPPGWYQLSLAPSGALPRRTVPVLIPKGSSELHGYIESRAGLRIAGWTLVAAAVIASVALTATATKSSQQCVPAPYGPPLCQTVTELDTAKMAAGIVTLAVGVPIGILMGLAPDVPRIEPRGAGNPSPSPGKAPGVVVTGGF